MRTLQQIKSDIDTRITNCLANPISLTEALEVIKSAIEDVIRHSGANGKKSLITSQQIINLLHEVVKSSLIAENVNPTLIQPPSGRSRGEKTLAGFLKFKKQDICVFPNNKTPRVERIDFNGLYNTGTTEPYGELFSEHVLSINVRSQLSSLSKNIDTMFERTFAEPLNLHRRVPKMVLGEVYLISVRELDSVQLALNNVIYKPFTNSTSNYLEKYIKGFSALNMRASQRDDDFKYERVALIIADFSQNPVKVYNTTQDLINDNILPANSIASMANLNYDGLTRTLLDIHDKRFGPGILT
ncbi:hypothetical protein LX97_03171 [Nonlabens dokdonensis]|uniref:Uncharacterized protein n=1 Tax=Nonlabens dokdonensis TaxID=328515 RepID=A0ABX5PUI6_9FLAO|nr:hypothetical protein [Nonlabens dokdonensis]PZX37149.1 hypothetical protein LX97_03171 [Nonlabens dokdonensis]